MVYYVLAYSAAMVLFALLAYPVATVAGGIPLPRFTRAVLPAQTVALSSSSSLASLPALIEGAQSLELPPAVTGFVLPLSVAVFKVVTPIAWLIGTLFLAKLYGVALGATAVATIAFTSVLLSLTIPGVPQGAMLMLATLIGSFGVPAAGMGLLIGADTIPDLFATMANVTGDLVAGTIVGRHGTERVVADSQPDAPSSVDA
jgi:proton glutamate symport protein